jgi:poly-gamma-glutamate synthesis protein (capsule biosynthesis protein)
MRQKLKFFLLLLPVLMLFGCGTPKALEQKAQIVEVPERDSLTLLAAGDNLFHDTLLASCLGKDGYDFTPVYGEVKSIVQSADIAFINQETVMAGEQFGYSGYPRFNTPRDIAKVLWETGFTLVNHANNHALDMGEAGLLATLDVWNAIPGLSCIGIRRSPEESLVIAKNNIRLGFLTYTSGTNGIPLPKDKPWLVPLARQEAMKKEIAALRPLCDILVVSMHWGDEYNAEPGAEQLNLAAFLAEQNVDLVIGHHPHVLQRFETLPRPDGKKMFCFYSLGNFISHQRRKETIFGAFMYVKIEKTGKETVISDSALIPVVSHFDRDLGDTKVIPLYSYSDELLEKHWIRMRDKELTMEYFYSVIKSLGSKIIMRDPALP